MKKHFIKRLLTFFSLLMFGLLPGGCSEFFLADHPCCVAEKRAFETAEKIFDQAVEAEKPSLIALLNAQLELIRLESIERDCKNNATNPTVECKEERTAANNQQTKVNNLIEANRPFKQKIELADITRINAGKTLDACAKRNNCTP